MSIRSMIDAARVGNAVEFEKHFVNETQERLSAALTARRSQIVGGMFGLSENDLTEEDFDAIHAILEELTEEQLEQISEMSDVDAFEVISELVTEDTNKVAAKRGAAAGAAAGAVRHVADRVIHKGVNKVGRGVKKVAQKVGLAKKSA